MNANAQKSLQEMTPRLRAEFESSRELVKRARERAERSAAAPQTMRELLQQARTARGEAGASERNIWEAAAREITRVARERDRAFGVLAHELRQGLSAAVAAERVIALNGDSPAAERGRAILQRQLMHLAHLVESLLDYSRLSLRTVSIGDDVLNIVDVVRQAAEAAEAIAESRRQDLAVHLPADAVLVKGDAVRLQQVFSNVLLNALRYTPHGGRIQASVLVQGDAAQVEVVDTGVGFTAAQRDTLFEPFTRGASDGPGLGIGLALARRIVELHRGRITAASDGPERGSTFSVILPLHPPPA